MYVFDSPGSSLSLHTELDQMLLSLLLFDTSLIHYHQLNEPESIAPQQLRVRRSYIGVQVSERM